MFLSGKKKWTAPLLGCLAAIFLVGCGGSSDRTKEAMELIRELEYSAALEVLDAAEEAGENIRLISRARGIAHMGLAEYDTAVDCFEEALSHSNGLVEPVDFDLNYYLAAAHGKNGEYAEAVESYNAILALRPAETEAYFLRGCALLKLGDFQRAREDFDIVISMNPEDYDRLIEIYEVLAQRGYKEAGQEYLTSALDKGAGNLDVYDSGRMYYYLGEYQKAYIALEEARSGGDAESYLYLGRAYEATGDYNYASSVYNSFLTEKGPNAEVYNQLGICEMAKGDYRKALEAFQSGIALEDKSYQQTLMFNQIVAYEYLGEFQTAAVMMKDYLKMYPDDEAALREQIFLATR